MSNVGNWIGLIGSCVAFAGLVWQTVRAHRLEKELEACRAQKADGHGKNINV